MKTIICFGDSITAGRSVPENSRWTSILQSALAQRPGPGWDVYTRGVPGDAIKQGLERFDKEVEGRLPAWVLIEFGLNDCSYQPNRQIPRTGLAEFGAVLNELIRLVRSGGGRPVLLTNHCVRQDRIDESSQRLVMDNLRPYQAAIREAASSTDVPLIDVEAGFASRADASSGLAADGIHLSLEGHVLYAELVLEGLTPILDSAA